MFCPLWKRFQLNQKNKNNGSTKNHQFIFWKCHRSKQETKKKKDSLTIHPPVHLIDTHLSPIISKPSSNNVNVKMKHSNDSFMMNDTKDDDPDLFCYWRFCEIENKRIILKDTKDIIQITTKNLSTLPNKLSGVVECVTHASNTTSLDTTSLSIHLKNRWRIGDEIACFEIKDEWGQSASLGGTLTLGHLNDTSMIAYTTSQLNNHIMLNALNDFTFECWFKLLSNNTDMHRNRWVLMKLDFKNAELNQINSLYCLELCILCKKNGLFKIVLCLTKDHHMKDYIFEFKNENHAENDTLSTFQLNRWMFLSLIVNNSEGFIPSILLYLNNTNEPTSSVFLKLKDFENNVFIDVWNDFKTQSKFFGQFQIGTYNSLLFEMMEVRLFNTARSKDKIYSTICCILPSAIVTATRLFRSFTISKESCSSPVNDSPLILLHRPPLGHAKRRYVHKTTTDRITDHTISPSDLQIASISEHAYSQSSECIDFNDTIKNKHCCQISQREIIHPNDINTEDVFEQNQTNQQQMAHMDDFKDRHHDNTNNCNRFMLQHDSLDTLLSSNQFIYKMNEFFQTILFPQKNENNLCFYKLEDLLNDDASSFFYQDKPYELLLIVNHLLLSVQTCILKGRVIMALKRQRQLLSLIIPLLYYQSIQDPLDTVSYFFDYPMINSNDMHQSFPPMNELCNLHELFYFSKSKIQLKTFTPHFYLQLKRHHRLLCGWLSQKYWLNCGYEAYHIGDMLQLHLAALSRCVLIIRFQFIAMNIIQEIEEFIVQACIPNITQTQSIDQTSSSSSVFAHQLIGFDQIWDGTIWETPISFIHTIHSITSCQFTLSDWIILITCWSKFICIMILIWYIGLPFGIPQQFYNSLQNAICILNNELFKEDIKQYLMNYPISKEKQFCSKEQTHHPYHEQTKSHQLFFKGHTVQSANMSLIVLQQSDNPDHIHPLFKLPQYICFATGRSIIKQNDSPVRCPLCCATYCQTVLPTVLTDTHLYKMRCLFCTVGILSMTTC